MDSVSSRSEDRISKLPDTVLSHILSFLTTKHSVGTSVLSSRWRYLWTTVPTLDFDMTQLFLDVDELSDERDKEVCRMFEHFVNRVLLLSDGPCFRKFHFKGILKDFDHVDSWISFAVKRNVQDLKLYNLHEDEDRVGLPVLPHIIFTCKTLSVLTLFGVLVDVRRSVWLPSLKILNLELVKYEDSNTIQVLLSGCPVVEELCIRMWIGDTSKVLDISVPTLKRLMLFYLRDNFEDGFKLVLDIPQLEYLDLLDHVSDEFFLSNLKSLSKASIMVGPTISAANSSNGEGLRVYNLLSGISRVQFLDTHFSFEIDTDGYLLPTFQNLTRFKFGGILNLNLLADFLQCSPILEVLILQAGYDEAIKFWNPPKQVPSCFSCLKEIQIEGFRGRGYELEMLEYFLQNSKVLGKMTIGHVSPDDCFCGKLVAFRKESKTCRIDVNCLKHRRIVEPKQG